MNHSPRCLPPCWRRRACPAPTSAQAGNRFAEQPSRAATSSCSGRQCAWPGSDGQIDGADRHPAPDPRWPRCHRDVGQLPVVGRTQLQPCPARLCCRRRCALRKLLLDDACMSRRTAVSISATEQRYLGLTDDQRDRPLNGTMSMTPPPPREHLRCRHRHRPTHNEFGGRVYSGQRDQRRPRQQRLQRRGRGALRRSVYARPGRRLFPVRARLPGQRHQLRRHAGMDWVATSKPAW